MKHYILSFILISSITCSFGAKIFNIKSFGALGDGLSINTIAIQKAIDQAHAAGGGIVLIPAGKFVSGSIVLKNGVELHLEKQAFLLGSIEIADYIKLNRWKALIMADGASNISISGKGIIDGRGAESTAFFMPE